MDIREKLVELLGKNARCPKEVSNCHDCPYWADDVGCYEDEATADMLINNGVTMQEWIPVSDGLPEKSGEYLTYCGDYDGVCVLYYEVLKTKGKWRTRWKEVTHWMPLPQPPKGE